MATGTLALSFQRWVRGEQSCLGGRDPLWGSVRMGPRWAKGQGGLCGETPSLSPVESELSPKGFSHHPICSS